VLSYINEIPNIWHKMQSKILAMKFSSRLYQQTLMSTLSKNSPFDSVIKLSSRLCQKYKIFPVDCKTKTSLFHSFIKLSTQLSKTLQSMVEKKILIRLRHKTLHSNCQKFVSRLCQKKLSSRLCQKTLHSIAKKLSIRLRHKGLQSTVKITLIYCQKNSSRLCLKISNSSIDQKSFWTKIFPYLYITYKTIVFGIFLSSQFLLDFHDIFSIKSMNIVSSSYNFRIILLILFHYMI
jgi:hypothetical protein